LTDSKKDKLLSFDFDTPAFLETARDAFYSPHTQGAIQAIGGLCETIAGGAAILASDDFSAIIGCAAMIHGMDHFITGMKTAICGEEFNTVSSQLLQGAGLSSQSADLIDIGLSVPITMGVAGMVRAGEFIASEQCFLPVNGRCEKELFKFSHAAANHMSDANRMIPVQILDEIIQSPMVAVKDPRGTADAIMYYSQFSRNGNVYNAEVLYSEKQNVIMHFKYCSDSIGPLKKVK